MATPHFSDQDFNELVLKSDKPVMVDFYAEWCGPCKLAAPIIEELALINKDKVLIGKVDVDATTVSAKYGVMSIPTVIMFKGGQEVDRKVGFGGKGMYEEMIKKVLNG
jgi:thioredoxin 1